jgi:hypothetical protein
VSLQTALHQTIPLTPESFDRFSNLIDPDWIDQALHTTGTASIRRRRLPAERVVWLVIGLALFRNEPIWHIVRQLGLSLNAATLPSPSVSVQGRQRLGDTPLASLFQRLARHWGATHQPVVPDWLGLRTLAVDGVVWSTPDTVENRAAFGGGRSQHGEGAWPQVRGVCLMDTENHLLLGAEFGSFATGELSYARALMAETPDHSLTIFDRAYYAAAFLLDWQQAGQQRHWLMRAKTALRYEVVHTLGKGDWWVRLPVSPQARQSRPDLPSHWEARLIECRRGGEIRRYLTSLADAQRYRADLLADHYRKRWEIELGYREIKQGLLAGETTLRSKQPTLVRQEVWGLLIAYNLLREEMRQMAQMLEVPPQQVSFQWAALAIVGLLRYCPLETAGTLPKRLALLREQARLYLLPPRRKRSYPRQVKPRAAKYPTKKCQSA